MGPSGSSTPLLTDQSSAGPSGDRVAEKERLIAARAVWLTRLSDVLDGRVTLDDVDGMVAEYLGKADDLRQQLILIPSSPVGW